MKSISYYNVCRKNAQKKSQVSIEFMMTTAMMIIIFTAIFLMAKEKSQDNTDFEAKTKLKQACEYISGVITDVYNSGDGSRIIGRVDDYNITVFGTDKLIVSWMYKRAKNNQSYNCKFQNIPVTNGYNYTFNIEKRQSFIVENVKGVVEIRKTSYEDGLLLWLRMDGNNTRFTTKDSGPFDYSAVLLRKASCWTAGFRAQGCTFDGTEDSISVYDSSILNNRQQATISMIIKWTGIQTRDSSETGPYGPVLSRKKFGGFTNQLIGLNSPNPATATIRWNPYSPTEALDGTVTVGDGVWRHVVISYRSGNHSIYVNGALDKSSALTGTISNDATVSLLIAEWNATSDVYFKGMIDDLRIYNRSFDAVEVKHLYDMYNSYFQTYPGDLPR